MMRIEKIVFWGGLILGLICHAITLPYSPAHWMDEVQITELGRQILSPGSDWSMYILPTSVTELGGSGVWNVGRTLQELAYRLGGASAPRWMELFCLMTVAILVRFYVAKKTSSAWLGTIFGLLAFSAPGLVQSAHGARVDAMAMMFLFAALSVMQLGDCQQGAARRPILMILAGAFTALCVYTWATAIMMVPIVLWEFIETAHRSKTTPKEWLLLFGCAVVGGLLITALDFLPCYESIAGTLVKIGNSSKAVGYGRKIGFGTIVFQLFEVPGLYFVGFCCLFVRRRLWLLAAAAVIFLHVTKGQIYVFRTLYILPYALIGFAVLCGLVRRTWFKRSLVGVAVLMMFVAFARSVVVRNAVEFLARDYRDSQILMKVLEREIGRDASVYNYAFQTYYAGRELGWKQYQMFYNALVPPVELLKTVDGFLVDEKDAQRVNRDDLQAAGLVEKRVISVYPKPTSGIGRWLEQRNRLHRLGDYVFFSKGQSEGLRGGGTK